MQFDKYLWAVYGQGSFTHNFIGEKMSISIPDYVQAELDLFAKKEPPWKAAKITKDPKILETKRELAIKLFDFLHEVTFIPEIRSFLESSGSSILILPRVECPETDESGDLVFHHLHKSDSALFVLQKSGVNSTKSSFYAVRKEHLKEGSILLEKLSRLTKQDVWDIIRNHLQHLRSKF